MALVLSSDVSPASWIVESDVSWYQLVGFGPAVFPAYARLRFVPDPAYEGQSENDVPRDAARDDDGQWRTLLELLAAGTRTPDDCYFCLWEGWGFSGSLDDHPKLSVYLNHPRRTRGAARSYFLFRGPLSDVGDWGMAEFDDGDTSPYEPALVWPADHAWCVAKDVDPHWAGIGASASLIDRVVADPRIDAVAADPAAEQPAYRA